jgi:hypothetical protein
LSLSLCGSFPGCRQRELYIIEVDAGYGPGVGGVWQTISFFKSVCRAPRLHQFVFLRQSVEGDHKRATETLDRLAVELCTADEHDMLA